MDRPELTESVNLELKADPTTNYFAVAGLDEVILVYTVILESEIDVFPESIARASFGDPLEFGGIKTEFYDTAVVPLPAAAWLFISAAVGVATLGRAAKQ
jgi:hypothetical protein